MSAPTAEQQLAELKKQLTELWLKRLKQKTTETKK